MGAKAGFSTPAPLQVLAKPPHKRAILLFVEVLKSDFHVCHGEGNRCDGAYPLRAKLDACSSIILVNKIDSLAFPRDRVGVHR